MAHGFTVQTSLGLSLVHNSRETLINYAPKAPPLFTLRWIDPNNDNAVQDMYRPAKSREDLVLSVNVNEPERIQPLKVQDDEGFRGATGQAFKYGFEIALHLMRYDPEKHRMQWNIEEVCEVTNILAQSGFQSACKELKRQNQAIVKTKPQPM